MQHYSYYLASTIVAVATTIYIITTATIINEPTTAILIHTIIFQFHDLTLEVLSISYFKALKCYYCHRHHHLSHNRCFVIHYFDHYRYCHLFTHLS